MGNAVYVSPQKSLPVDSSTTRFLVVISRDWHNPNISVKIKSTGDPKEAGGIRLGIDLDDYLLALVHEWRRASRLIRWMPKAWLTRSLTAASREVLEKVKQASVHGV